MADGSANFASTLHAAWVSGPAGGGGGDAPALWVWAEPPAGCDALRDAVGELTPDALLPASAPAVDANLWLPAPTPPGGGALPSPAAMLSPSPSLAPAVRSALQFSPAEAVDLLQSLPDPLPAHCGDSVRYWRGLAGFVIGKITGRHFYPAVVRPGPGREVDAVWRLALGGREEVDRLERFAAAMPPVCRAVAGAEAVEALDLVESFLSAGTDALVRRAAATDPFFSRVHELSDKPGAEPEVRWLSALLRTDPPDDRRVRGEMYEVNALAEQIDGWVGRLTEPGPDTRWRLRFRLLEPEDAPDALAEVDAGIASEHGGMAAEAGSETPGVGASGAGAAGAEAPGAGAPAGMDANGVEGDEDGRAEQVAEGTADTAVAMAFAQTPVPEVNDARPEPMWEVRFELRAETADGEDAEPIDASVVWAEGGTISRSTARQRAALAEELQRAAPLFPPLSRVLGDAAPVLVDLTAAEAHALIRRWAEPLRAEGFDVILPDWAGHRQSPAGLLIALRPAAALDGGLPPGFLGSAGAGGRGGTTFSDGPGRFGIDSLLEFDWRVSLGGLDLSPQEFEALVSRQSPLVRVGGRWIEIDADAQAAAERIRAQPGGSITLADAFRTVYAVQRGGTGAAGVPVVGITGTAWVRNLLEQTPPDELEATPQPEGFLGTLRPYQQRGLRWLAFLDRLGLGACLADDMGLGKTIQLIALLLHERGVIVPPATSPPVPTEAVAANTDHSGVPSPTGPSLVAAAPAAPRRTAGPTLLFAPTSVLGNWVRELERFAPELRVMLHQGADRHRGPAFVAAARDVDVVVTGYPLAHRDLDDLKLVPWHRLALDEAQKIKNPSAAASVAIRAVPAPRRVALTGTPIENHLSELWSIMDVLNPGLLGTAREFRDKFAVPVEKLADRDRADHLRRLIRPFVLRRTKSDPEVAGDLPDKMEMKVYCGLTAEQAALYERITAQMLSEIDAATGIRRRGLILAVLTRLKQVCDHPILVADSAERDAATAATLEGRSGKCERLVDMLEEVLEEGDAALVFTQYREMGHLLERVIAGRLKTQPLFLHGGVPQKKRDEMVRQFQEPGTQRRVFLLSLRAGGLGLNLTAASHVFHYDRWWNPAIENQATDRAHRIGQVKRVQVHKFVSIGTVEERIDKLLAEKTRLAETIVGTGDEWLTNLSTTELREYLQLTDKSVGEF